MVEFMLGLDRPFADFYYIISQCSRTEATFIYTFRILLLVIRNVGPGFVFPIELDS